MSVRLPDQPITSRPAGAPGAPGTPPASRRAVRRPGRVGWEVAGLGGIARPRVLGVLAVVLAFAVAGLVASVSIGEFPIPAGDVFRALTGTGGADATLIVRELRLPRALTGLLVGFAFGLAGALMQAVTRNPLASPDLIGISAGASTGGVAAILIGGVTAAGAGSYASVPLGALVGALVAAGVIYTMAFRDGTITGFRFVLVGIGVQGALGALTSWLLARADINEASRAMVWLTGSLNGRGFEHARWAGLALLVTLPVVLALIRPYQLLQYGDDTARALGLPVDRARVALLLASVVLAGVATAAAGPIGFVALAAPQIARRLTGTANLPLLTSGCVGAALMLGADLAARLVLAPLELPVGVVTGAVGAPYLMWLLTRANRIGRAG
ncbi:FecCD family ABC transporter permease [Plantactinospora alkalitolerans]|uniref:FecCD family ABC transporter permease n=1 Tax=Plantactinospora alkalitolerans TaxID=2789879 RepID=UPI002B1F84D3|nr:iron chelate uptake ABC transporter family permease subunit [Plantactinospora alkalitolerans]